MPFASQAQRSWMYANHPAMAKRWEQVTPKGKLPDHKMKDVNAESESNESPKPGLKALPRVPGNKRDYGMLTPDAKARHPLSPGTKEQDFTKEEPVQAHTGFRPDKMKLDDKELLDKFAKRDVKLATRKKV